MKKLNVLVAVGAILAVATIAAPVVAVIQSNAPAAAGMAPTVLDAGSTVELQVTGRGGVPDDASAVVLNLTALNADESGYVTAWPCGVPRPTASSLNYVAGGGAVANSTLVQVGDGGDVCLFTDRSTELVVDVNGWFANGSDFTSEVPARLFDTRNGDGGPRPAGSTVELQVTGRAGVPDDASSVVLNLTALDADEGGFVTAWPCGAPRPTASSLNYVAGGAAVANSTLVQVGDGGDVCLFTDRSTELIVDVNGWFADDSDFLSDVPSRLFDTRDGDEGPRPAGSTLELEVTGLAGVPDDASAVVLNLTALNADESGYVTAWACGVPRPTASSLNYVAGGGAVANTALVQVGDGGDVCLYSDRSTDLVVDVNGWFSPGSDFTSVVPDRILDTREPAPPSAPAAPGNPPASPNPAPDPTGAAFIETFDGNAGLDRFETGVFHRDVDVQGWGGDGGSWSADHNIHLGLDNCGNPDEGHEHTVTKADRAGANFVCRDHWMTTMGDVDGYSIVWGSPDATFTTSNKVSWEVNSTHLGSRLWWEVALVPADASNTSCIDWLPCDVPSYPPGAVVIGNRDDYVRVWANDREVDATWQTICRDGQDSLDLEGCLSKSIRRQWSVIDNEDGTLTVQFMDNAWTTAGAFPDGEWKVVFKHHAYTPNKDNDPVGYTFHWDNIFIGR